MTAIHMVSAVSMDHGHHQKAPDSCTASVAAQAIHISMAPGRYQRGQHAPWISISMSSGCSTDQRYLNDLQWLHGPQTSTQTLAAIGPRTQIRLLLVVHSHPHGLWQQPGWWTLIQLPMIPQTMEVHLASGGSKGLGHPHKPQISTGPWAADRPYQHGLQGQHRLKRSFKEVQSKRNKPSSTSDILSFLRAKVMVPLGRVCRN